MRVGTGSVRPPSPACVDDVVLVEAMATAAPMVAVDDGGVREVFKPGVTALLARRGNHDAVTSAVLQLLADPLRAAAMGQAGRARSEGLFELGGLGLAS